MAQNLLKVGHVVSGFDVNAEASEWLAASGGKGTNSIGDACNGAEVVVTMLPAGEHVRQVYLDEGGVLAVTPGCFIDSSTIDVTARDVARAAEGRGLDMVDAPVSGGVTGRRARR